MPTNTLSALDVRLIKEAESRFAGARAGRWAGRSFQAKKGRCFSEKKAPRRGTWAPNTKLKKGRCFSEKKPPAGERGIEHQA